MTQEEKQLLLKDLCARLPYGVRCAGWLNIKNIEDVDKVYPWIDGEYIDGITQDKIRIQGTWVKAEYVKPYLRPMSSMTDEEKAQVQMFVDLVTDENYGDGYSPSAWDTMNSFVQYCDSHHLDHRGLIFRGLALEAPEGMYNLKGN